MAVQSSYLDSCCGARAFGNRSAPLFQPCWVRWRIRQSLSREAKHCPGQRVHRLPGRDGWGRRRRLASGCNCGGPVRHLWNWTGLPNRSDDPSSVFLWTPAPARPWPDRGDQDTIRRGRQGPDRGSGLSGGSRPRRSGRWRSVRRRALRGNPLCSMSRSAANLVARGLGPSRSRSSRGLGAPRQRARIATGGWSALAAARQTAAFHAKRRSGMTPSRGVPAAAVQEGMMRGRRGCVCPSSIPRAVWSCPSRGTSRSLHGFWWPLRGSAEPLRGRSCPLCWG